MCQLEKGPYTVEPQGVVPGRGEEREGREGGGGGRVEGGGEERRGGKKRRKGERGKRESNIRGVCVDVRRLLLHALV